MFRWYVPNPVRFRESLTRIIQDVGGGALVGGRSAGLGIGKPIGDMVGR